MFRLRRILIIAVVIAGLLATATPVSATIAHGRTPAALEVEATGE